MKTGANSHEMNFDLLLLLVTSFLDLASTDPFMCSDLKRILAGKKLSHKEEVIIETEA